MDGSAWTAVAAILSVIVTAIVAPKIKDRRDARLNAQNARTADRKSELDTIREEQRELRQALKDEVNELRNENVRKDARIEVLEARVSELQNTVEMFRLGLTHPPGFVLVPANVWVALRERLGTEIPPGPFVGEDITNSR